MMGVRKTSAVLLGLVAATALSGCFLTRGTTEATNELFAATGHVFEATTDLTSPNSSHGHAKHRQLETFVAFNFDNLTQDIARGEGEYLTSFTTLLDVPAQRHPALFRLVQERYPVLASTTGNLQQRTQSMVSEFQTLSARLD